MSKAPAAEQDKIKEFQDRLNDLLTEYGYRLEVQPGLKQQIDGTYTIGFNIIVVQK